MQQISLVYDGPMADVFIDGRPRIEQLQAAFSQAFDVPAPSVFDGEDASISFVDFLDRHTVAEIWSLDRQTFATKLNIYLFERGDVTGKLARLAAVLRMPVAVDVGGDIADDRALQFMPDGAVVAGCLEPVPTAVGMDDVRFCETKAV